MLSPHQIRGARAMLTWSAAELAKHAGVHVSTVQRLERNGAGPRGNVASLEKLRRALESAGIHFVEDDGVRLLPR